jgi:hypothetical protein
MTQMLGVTILVLKIKPMSLIVQDRLVAVWAVEIFADGYHDRRIIAYLLLQLDSQTSLLLEECSYEILESIAALTYGE